MGLHESKMSSRWAQDGTKWAPEKPKMGSQAPQEVPNWPWQAFQHRKRKKASEPRFEMPIFEETCQKLDGKCKFSPGLKRDPNLDRGRRDPGGPLGEGDIGEGVDQYRGWKSHDLAHHRPKTRRILLDDFLVYPSLPSPPTLSVFRLCVRAPVRVLRRI